MISGVLYALLAGLMWGLIFVGPLLVPEYPAMLQSMGRYLALGLIALPLAWLGRARGCRILARGATAPALRWRWDRWSAGPGMLCATPAGCGRTRINRQ